MKRFLKLYKTYTGFLELRLKRLFHLVIFLSFGLGFIQLPYLRKLSELMDKNEIQSIPSILMFFALYLLYFIVALITNYVKTRYIEISEQYMGIKFASNCSSKWSLFRQREASEFIRDIQGELNKLHINVLFPFVTFFENIISGLVLILFIFYLNPVFTIFLFLFCISLDFSILRCV